MATPPKPESAPAAAKAPAKGEAAAEAPAAASAPAPSAGRGGLMAWLPVIAVVLLAPVATWATVEFVVLPRLQKKIAAGPADAHAEGEAEHAPAAESGGHGGKGKEGKGKESGPPGYEFQNVVVNLSGTMGTRYLKTNVFIVSKDPKIKEIFEGDKPRLTDITQAVLAGLTLADIEELGARNVIRAKLVSAYNEALRRKVVEEVYLTDFVVQ